MIKNIQTHSNKNRIFDGGRKTWPLFNVKSYVVQKVDFEIFK